MNLRDVYKRQLMSYLLFESSYTKRLIELGYADTMQRNDEVIAFFKEAQA